MWGMPRGICGGGGRVVNELEEGGNEFFRSVPTHRDPHVYP